MKQWRRLLGLFLVFEIFASNLLPACAAPKKHTRKAKPTFSAITRLNNRDLKKCELSGVHKKDWNQRLQWFESKIINHYKKLNKKNILVVGQQKFLNEFKSAAKKHGMNANIEYVASANLTKARRGGGMI